MDLLHNIKRDRARQNRKQRLGGEVFTTVACIIKTYGLDGHFLEAAAEPEGSLARCIERLPGVKPKRLLEQPPFCLLPQGAYRLALGIIERWSSPYLALARTPEEIRLAQALYDANPSLTPRDLLRCDFEALLLRERAKREVQDLERLLRCEGGRPSRGDDGGCRAEEQRSSHSSLARIDQLRAFIAEVDRMESQTHDTLA